MGKVSKVVLYTTSTATTLKLKHDIKRIKELLEAKKVHYEEVDLAEQPDKRTEMMLNSGDPPRATLPQLHVNGKFLGDTHTIQELEDYGELEDALSGSSVN